MRITKQVGIKKESDSIWYEKTKYSIYATAKPIVTLTN